MIRKLLHDQAGYSLVEVLAAIMILSIAILPMVGMFDAGLRAAVLGSNYDKARAIADEEMAEVRALPYRVDGAPVDSVFETYPPGTTTSCTPPIEGGFTCQVETTYVRLDSGAVVADPKARTMMQVEVDVTWNDGSNAYTMTGLISKETR